MTRKEKCTMLRLFLVNIAEKNNSIYLSSECDQDCDCSGPCKKLHAELCSLLKALRYYGEDDPVTLSAKSLYANRFYFSDPDRFFLNYFLKVPEEVADESWYIRSVSPSDWESPEPEEPEEPDQEAARAMEELLASPINLPLSCRAFTTLARNDICTMGDLAKMSERDFMMVPGMTTKVFWEIHRRMEEAGLYIQRDI